MFLGGWIGLSSILRSNLRCLLLSFVRKSAITSTKVASPLLFSPTDTTTIAAQIPISVLEYLQDYNIYDHHKISEMHAIPMSSDDNESRDQEVTQILQSLSSNTASVPSKQNGHSLTTSSSALLDGLELSLFVISIGFICPLLLIFNTCLYLKRLKILETIRRALVLSCLQHLVLPIRHHQDSLQGPTYRLEDLDYLTADFETYSSFSDYDLPGIRGYLCIRVCKGFHG